MTVIFLHDLNAAGFGDLDALLNEAMGRFGNDIAQRLCAHTGPMGSSQEVAAVVAEDTPAEDLELLSTLVELSELAPIRR